MLPCIMRQHSFIVCDLIIIRYWIVNVPKTVRRKKTQHIQHLWVYAFLQTMVKTTRTVLVPRTLAKNGVPQLPDMAGNEGLTAGGTVYVDQIQWAMGGNTRLALWKPGSDTELFSKRGDDHLDKWWAIGRSNLEFTGKLQRRHTQPAYTNRISRLFEAHFFKVTSIYACTQID